MTNRLSSLPTLRIDSSRRISFLYKDKKYYGVQGDTVATALYANGIRIFARSLKYHRPRGIYSLDGECSNTCMEVDGIPNVRCENTLLQEGMVIKGQNVAGSLEHDKLSFIDKIDWMMPAGFYYNTMHKPAKIWPVAMKQIRKAAGLGTLSPDYTMKGTYDEIFPTADVCVIGGGPAGMSAALTAADKGLRVILLESRPVLGGFFEYRSHEYTENQSYHERAKELANKVNEAENIRVFTHASMIGTYNNNLVTGFQIGGETDSFDERYIEIRAISVIVATGSIERPLLFENNERPGIMQMGCALRMAHTYGLKPGNTAVFSIGHDLGIETAICLHDLGVKIACVADIRKNGQDSELVADLRQRNIHFLKGWVATKAHGKKQIKKVTLTTLKGLQATDYSCDLLVASAGLTPLTSGISVAKGTLKYDGHTGCFLPSRMPPEMHAAGRINGFHDGRSIESSGRLAGIKAAIDCDACPATELTDAIHELETLPGPAAGNKLVIAPVKGRKSFICFDEDTTIKNINQAIDKGFDVPELIKRFTSAGTGPGQGGIPGHNLPLYVAHYQGLPSVSIKSTNVRPPVVPTLLSTYAGSNHSMFKRTAMDVMQREDGGVFRSIGVWQRARYFSNDFSCKNEIENVRTNVGILDGSTLGKFRIFGPDAVKAMERVFVSDISKIKEGRVKYSAMCNDDGCVIDDGVIVKQGENDYYFTTSTGRAGSTIEWIRYHSRYDKWDFHMVNLTDSMGVINLSGPNARKVLEKIVDIDVSNDGFGFSEYKEFKINETIPIRAMRLGFVGELSYELHVPASYMQSVWLMLKDAGKEFSIKNFGVEAQNVLRMEKCHIILGQESEQRTNLLDVGLGFLWNRDKPEAKTIGAVALRQAENDTTRLKLVAFTMENKGRAPRDGSLIVDKKVRGYICTARDSFTLNQGVGMALVEGDLSDIGTRLEIYEDECGDDRIYGKVVKMPLYDSEGTRMKM